MLRHNNVFPMPTNQISRSAILLTLLLAPFCLYAQAKPEDALKLKQLDDIKVTGTHLPAQSVIRLAGLKVGDKVNDLIVNTACHKITSTGLVHSIDYFYDMYPDKPGVTLNLTLVDEPGLLPATIKPEADDTALWNALLAIDPIFLRQMPRTEKALAFYAANLGKILEQQGRSDSYAAPDVVSNAAGEPAAIVFEIRKYKSR